MRRPLDKREEGILKYLLIGTSAFNIADYFLTTLALSMGYREANPLINLIVDTLFFPAIKIIIIPLLLYSVWLRRHKVGPRILIYSAVVFVAYYLLMVYFKVQIWMWVMR